MTYQSMLSTQSDRQTFAQIYEEMRNMCYYTAMAVTRNNQMAEDAVHNAFLSVIKHKDEIFNLPSAKRRSKIILIVKNKAIDIMRKEKLRTHETIDKADHVADSADVCADILKQEAIEIIIDGIQSLPEKYRIPFELRYVHEMTNMEIAALLGISSKSVSTRLSRGKAMLQEKLSMSQK